MSKTALIEEVLEEIGPETPLKQAFVACNEKFTVSEALVRQVRKKMLANHKVPRPRIVTQDHDPMPQTEELPKPSTNGTTETPKPSVVEIIRLGKQLIKITGSKEEAQKLLEELCS